MKFTLRSRINTELQEQFEMNSKTQTKQLSLLKKMPNSYGGELLKTRKGRARGRPLDTKNTMHLVLRSSKAKGDWSFKKSKNARNINAIIAKFSKKYGVRILSYANVGNHLHFHIKLTNRHTYKPFIRAISSAIVSAVTGCNRWQSLDDIHESQLHSYASKAVVAASSKSGKSKTKFWDYRPFTRVVIGFRALLGLKDYIRINQMEGFGFTRSEARGCLWVESQILRWQNSE